MVVIKALEVTRSHTIEELARLRAEYIELKGVEAPPSGFWSKPIEKSAFLLL